MRIGILLLTLFLLPVISPAQDTSATRTKPPAPEFFLTTIPIRCVLRDINVGFAHRIGWHHTLEGRIGWVHGNKFLHDKWYNSWLNSTEMLFSGPSFYTQLNHWKMNKKGKRGFIGVIVGYRYLFFQDKIFHIYDNDGRSYDDDLLLSQWRNDFLLLGTIGVGTTKFSMTEISLGARFMFTHTNVIDTLRPIPFPDQESYENYVKSRLEQMPNDEGFNIVPIIRITSRVGWMR